MPTASAGASGGGPSKHAVGAAARTASQGPRGFGTRRVAAESGRPPREPAARRRRDGRDRATRATPRRRTRCAAVRRNARSAPLRAGRAAQGRTRAAARRHRAATAPDRGRGRGPEPSQLGAGAPQRAFCPEQRVLPSAAHSSHFGAPRHTACGGAAWRVWLDHARRAVGALLARVAAYRSPLRRGACRSLAALATRSWPPLRLRACLDRRRSHQRWQWACALPCPTCSDCVR